MDYSTYLKRLQDLATEEVTDSLKEEILGRLLGNKGPALLRDEYDVTEILYGVYDRLENQQKEKELHRLKESVIYLFMEYVEKCNTTLNIKGQGISVEHMALLNRLANLVVHYLHPEDWSSFQEKCYLLPHLSDTLYGFLFQKFRQPLEKIARLDGQELELAILVLDLWAAITPYQFPSPVKDPVLKTMEDTLTNTVEDFQGRGGITQEKSRLLLLVIQCNILLRPKATAEKLDEIILVIKRFDSCSATIKTKRRWFNICREYELLFEEFPQWRKEFVAGIRELPKSLLPLETDSRKLLMSSLGKMGLTKESKRFEPAEKSSYLKLVPKRAS